MSDTPSGGMPPQADAPAREHEVVLARRYRFERLLGTGAMGSVWEGYDLELERAVAVKLMAPDVAHDPDLRSRFNREAKAAAGLRTRHVVEVYDFGIDDDTPYIVMEKLEGEDLRARLRRVKRLGLEETARILAQAAKALEQARKAGIVHRDLKPGNVFLARVDDEEVVKILDFGVAKQIQRSRGSETTKSGVVLGSPAYLSPEQARGRTLDHRSDLWALAAVAYRALTGRPTFGGESDGDILVKICTEHPLPPSSLAPTLTPEIDAFFAKAFAHDPDRRFQSATELVRAFITAADIAPLSFLAEQSGAFEVPSFRPSDLVIVPSRPDSLKGGEKTGSHTAATWTAGALPRFGRPRRLKLAVVVLALAGVGATAGAFLIHRREPPTNASVVAPASEAPAPTSVASAPEPIEPAPPPSASSSAEAGSGPVPRTVSRSRRTSTSTTPYDSATPAESKDSVKRRWGY